MEDAENEERAERRSVERSAAYPGNTIDESIAFAREVHRHFRYEYGKRDDLSELIDTYSNRIVAACRQYGILEREKDSYKITEEFRQFLNPIDEEEQRNLMLLFFHSPKLYSDLLEKFDGAELPNNLPVHLIRFHGIKEKAASAAADIFVRNARMVGALDAHNRLDASHRTSASETSSDLLAEPAPLYADDMGSRTTIKAALVDPGVSSATHFYGGGDAQRRLLIPEITNEERLSIKLTGGKRATLSYPADLTEKDVEILKLQLQALSLSI